MQKSHIPEPLIFISQNIDNSNPASVITHYNGLVTSSARLTITDIE